MPDSDSKDDPITAPIVVDGLRDRSEFKNCFSPSSFDRSRHIDLVTEVPWFEHGPFAFSLMDLLQPRVFVELGTHTGFSYFSFCQAVRDLRLGTQCYAVDTWLGDDHAGFYGNEVYERVTSINESRYGDFSRLIRSRFDGALQFFTDGQIDLLHIDGRHGYEDVKEDFETWRPKLTARAVVLFHDTNVRERGFGVWKLWEEQAGLSPSFNFPHGNGLGVLALGPNIPAALVPLFDASPKAVVNIRKAYSRLGRAFTQERRLLEVEQALAQTKTEREAQITLLSRELETARASGEVTRTRLIAADASQSKHVASLIRYRKKLSDMETVAKAESNARAQHLEDKLRVVTALSIEHEERLLLTERERDAIRYSTVWRATRPLRRLLGSAGMSSIRVAVRRGAKATYWALTAQLFRRYTLWKRSRATPVLALTAVAGSTNLVPSRAQTQESHESPQPDPLSPTAWFQRYRRDADYGSISWQGSAQFSIIMPVYKVKPEWLEAAIRSVRRQTYPDWELICVDDHSDDLELRAVLHEAVLADPRVKIIALDTNEGVSKATNAGLAEAAGEFVLLLDHDDILEPHALARFADAAFFERPDIIYGDEVVTDETAETVYGVQARPIFSHTYYLSHPYIVHPVAIRTSIVRQLGGLDVTLSISQDVDLVLRALEISKRITHVPDPLYRWRTVPGSSGHVQKERVMEQTCAIKEAHLRRIGFADAKVRPGPSYNMFNVRYFGESSDRILGIIPTKNYGDMLKTCIESLLRTTKGLYLDILIINHQSDDPATLDYLREIEKSGRVIVHTYEGPFNYSKMHNEAVALHASGYEHLLMLNNDIEATEDGWLEAMLDLAMRADVGAVGATLLYPNGMVQHSGVIVGMHGLAEHAFKPVPFRKDDPGYGGSLHASREYSAVTAACVLVPVNVFNEVRGFDERLEVGFGDTDLCLRIAEAGYRIVNCAEAVLIHHESHTRGQNFGHDPHPQDSALFQYRYRDLIAEGDPHFSPLLATDNPTVILKHDASLPRTLRYRTTANFLPKGLRPATADPHGCEEA